MKKSILLVLVAALALAVGVSATAGAGVNDGAQAAAKKSAKCKAKKGKGKAGKSSAIAQAKKKGKGCKPKAQPKAAGLTDGQYLDAQNNVELTLSGQGKTATLKFRVPEFCVLFDYESQPVPAKASNGGIQASESTTITLAGVPVPTTWTLNVTKSLAYSLTASLTPPGMFASCAFSGTISGTLVKG